MTYYSQTFPRPSLPQVHVFSGEGKDKRPLADLVGRSEVFFPNDWRLKFFNACYQWLNVSLDACMIFVPREYQRHSPAIFCTSPKTACFVDVLGTSRPIIPREQKPWVICLSQRHNQRTLLLLPQETKTIAYPESLARQETSNKWYGKTVVHSGNIVA